MKKTTTKTVKAWGVFHQWYEGDVLECVFPKYIDARARAKGSFTLKIRPVTISYEVPNTKKQ